MQACVPLSVYKEGGGHGASHGATLERDLTSDFTSGLHCSLPKPMLVHPPLPQMHSCLLWAWLGPGWLTVAYRTAVRIS
jgi:hypothetical protein